MFCRTYRLERQLIIRIAKQYKYEPGPLKFAYLFKNAITVDEFFNFYRKSKLQHAISCKIKAEWKKKGWKKVKGRITKRCYTLLEPLGSQQ